MALRLIIQRRLPLAQGWPVWNGMGGRFASEYAGGLGIANRLWPGLPGVLYNARAYGNHFACRW